MADNLLRKTLLSLADAEVRFVVCGGVACILQGVPRSTHDLDLRVALDDENLRRVADAARALGLRPRVPEPLEALLDPERRRVWTEEKGALVYTLLAPDDTFAVDIFLRYPLPFEHLWQGADAISLDGRSVRVSSKRDLIDAKRAVQPPRKQDLRDIEDLEELLDG